MKYWYDLLMTNQTGVVPLFMVSLLWLLWRLWNHLLRRTFLELGMKKKQSIRINKFQEWNFCFCFENSLHYKTLQFLELWKYTHSLCLTSSPSLGFCPIFSISLTFFAISECSNTMNLHLWMGNFCQERCNGIKTHGDTMRYSVNARITSDFSCRFINVLW